MPRSARRYGSSTRNGESSSDASANVELGCRRDDAKKGELHRQLLERRQVMAEHDLGLPSVANSIASAVTNGLPPRSPPIHEPIVTAVDVSIVEGRALGKGAGGQPAARLDRRDHLEQAGLVPQALPHLVAHSFDSRRIAVCHSASTSSRSERSISSFGRVGVERPRSPSNCDTGERLEHRLAPNLGGWAVSTG
jgi:hypothetical protein